MTLNEWANQDWRQAQRWEAAWWNGENGACSNTFAEETKHLTYAYKMGLTAYTGPGTWPCYDMAGKSVLDIGGGPTSILLKCTSLGKSRVVDPCDFPGWVECRYNSAGIGYQKIRGEDLSCDERFQEAWIYNVLQHTEDPELIIMNAKKMAPVVRIFEWIDIPPCQGHPQELKEDLLNKWLGGEGRTEWLNENGCNAHAYFGIFDSHG